MLWVNADDLGYGADVNRAVVDSLARGSSSWATVMANMPGFEEACDLLRREGLVDRVGVHWVLTEGRPETDRIRRCPRFCDAEGTFALTRRQSVVRLDANERCIYTGAETPDWWSQRVVWMDRNEREAVCEELAAQLARCRARGLNPQHADTHHHVHEEWGILPVVMEVCRAEGIRWLRLARNMGRSTGMVRTVYRRWVNRRIRAWGLARTRYFGSWMDYRHALSHGQLADGDIEIMVHPRWNESGVLVDGTCGLPLERLREDAVARQ